MSYSPAPVRVVAAGISQNGMGRGVFLEIGAGGMMRGRVAIKFSPNEKNAVAMLSPTGEASVASVRPD